MESSLPLHFLMAIGFIAMQVFEETNSAVIRVCTAEIGFDWTKFAHFKFILICTLGAIPLAFGLRRFLLYCKSEIEKERKWRAAKSAREAEEERRLAPTRALEAAQPGAVLTTGFTDAHHHLLSFV